MRQLALSPRSHRAPERPMSRSLTLDLRPSICHSQPSHTRNHPKSNRLRAHDYVTHDLLHLSPVSIRPAPGPGPLRDSPARLPSAQQDLMLRLFASARYISLSHSMRLPFLGSLRKFSRTPRLTSPNSSNHVPRRYVSLGHQQPSLPSANMRLPNRNHPPQYTPPALPDPQPPTPVSAPQPLSGYTRISCRAKFYS